MGMGVGSRNYERADAGLEPFARSLQCCTAACDGFFEILEASGKRPRFARLSETPRALPPRLGGLLTHHTPVWHRERASRSLVPPAQPPLLVNSQTRRQI